METYYNADNIVFEEGIEATDSNFSWYCPESSMTTPKKVSRPPPGTRFNPEPCFPVTPLRTLPPLKGHCSGMKPVKNKKQKASLVGSNQTPSKTALKPKQSGKSACKKTINRNFAKPKREKKTATELLNFDISQIPSPFCSCTATAIGCYKWGSDGWQSACCTSNTSAYPLPVNPNKPGARVPGRKMSNGAYTKLLVKLVSEGHNLSEPIDLKDHWARHGTNKFVTIK